MVSRITLAAAAFLLCPLARALDLTPRVHFSELEGARSEVIAFRNGSSLVTWQAPHEWKLAGDPRRLSLFPPGASQAEAIVEVGTKSPSGVLDEAYVKALKEQMLQSLPREATAVEWAEDEPNPLLMNRHPTYKVTCSYAFFGQQFTRTVWVCDFAEQQVRFHFVARAQDYAKLHESFRASLYSWQGLP